jgi:hypothetical protein
MASASLVARALTKRSLDVGESLQIDAAYTVVYQGTEMKLDAEKRAVFAYVDVIENGSRPGGSARQVHLQEHDGPVVDRDRPADDAT